MHVNFYGCSITVWNSDSPRRAYARLKEAMADAGFELDTGGFQVEGPERWEDHGSTDQLEDA